VLYTQQPEVEKANERKIGDKPRRGKPGEKEEVGTEISIQEELIQS